MLALQEISDRLEIQDLIATYAHAIDDHDWDVLDTVFMPESIIDYTEVGGPRGTRDEIKRYLADSMRQFRPHQHLSATSKIKIDGDRATARTILFNPMSMMEDGKVRMFFVGLWYCDDLIRTPQGWRIMNRHEQKAWNFNAPEGMMP